MPERFLPVDPTDTTCSASHGYQWYNKTISPWFAFLFVPLYPIFLAMKNQAKVFTKVRRSLLSQLEAVAVGHHSTSGFFQLAYRCSGVCWLDGHQHLRLGGEPLCSQALPVRGAFSKFITSHFCFETDMTMDPDVKQSSRLDQCAGRGRRRSQLVHLEQGFRGPVVHCGRLCHHVPTAKVRRYAP